MVGEILLQWQSGLFIVEAENDFKSRSQALIHFLFDLAAVYMTAP